MTIDLYWIASGLLMIVSAILGWLGKTLLTAVRELERDVAALRTLVAGEYVRQDRLVLALQPLMDALVDIRDRLDGKADKVTR